MQKSVLVVFGKDLPQKSKKWYGQFNEIIGPKELESFLSPGSVQAAYELVNKLPGLIASDGRVLSKLVNYQGYELWWMNYDSIYYKFCLPYTQYRRLLLYLKNFEKIYLFQAPWPHLFQYFLQVHNRQCVILSKFSLKSLLPMPFGVFIQLFLSAWFLLRLKIAKPRLMLWTSDKFDPPRDHDFRYRFIYEELAKKKILFVEFVRSLESWLVVLRHAQQRKRPVFYTTAVINFIYGLAGLCGPKKQFERLFVSENPGERFQFLIATHYLNNVRGTIWSIKAIRFVLRWIGIKAAIIVVGVSRTFHELLACKLSGIKTVGIQHGAQIKHYCSYDFMPGFDGEKKLSVDRYGLWSDWWKKYFIEHSRAYNPEQFYISGHMRPLEKDQSLKNSPAEEKKTLKVLFIAEQLAAPLEIMPYLSVLLKTKEIDLYLKFRPYRDGFEEWLKKYRPETLKQIKILRGSMSETIAQTDVVVGSHSTAVLEALLQIKPFVFFWTDKWGDYFEIKKLQTQNSLFAENPEELIDCIKKSPNVSQAELKLLQKRFFGNPYQNGSQWVVEQAAEFLNS